MEIIIGPGQRNLLYVILWKLDNIQRQLNRMEKKENNIVALIDDTLADVQAETTVIASVVTLLQNLSAQIAAAGTDPMKLQAIKTQIDQNSASLAAAVIANTPAAPPATPAP